MLGRVSARLPCRHNGVLQSVGEEGFFFRMTNSMLASIHTLYRKIDTA